MDSPVLSLLAASVSFVVYLGYVLLAGTGTFWAVVWPDGQAIRRLRIMAVVGLALIGLGTSAEALIDWLAPGRALGEVAAESGTWLLVRLAVLAGAGFFGAEVLRNQVTDFGGWRDDDLDLSSEGKAEIFGNLGVERINEGDIDGVLRVADGKRSVQSGEPAWHKMERV